MARQTSWSFRILSLVALALGPAACNDDTGTSASTGGNLSVSITANPTSGRAPLQVAFTSNVSGGNGGNSYSWSFGDGTASSLKDPTVLFTSGGNYTVTLQVTSGNQKATSPPLELRIDSDLRVSCAVDPFDGRAPHTAGFRVDAFGGSGVFSYLWNFGDGGASTLQQPSHTYTSPGNYLARVTVTSGAASASCSQTVKVYGELGVFCQAVRLSGSTAKFGAAPTFCFSSSPCKYVWDFGDGTGAAGNALYHVQHTYGKLGIFTATAVVTTGESVAACSVDFESR